MISKEKVKAVFKKITAAIVETIVIISIGFIIGQYIGGLYIAADCKKFNLAKTGPTFVKCSVLEEDKSESVETTEEKK